MGVINIFIIQLKRPLLAEDLEAYVKARSAQMSFSIKFLYDSPQKEFSFSEYSNALDLYFPALGIIINGEIEYGIEDLSQAVDTVTYGADYSAFLTNIYKIGIDQFIDILKELFDAENVSWETM